jgi:oligopeptide transport system ATP-binding protein
MAEPLLDARGLSKRFTSGRGAARHTVQAVADVDLVIDAGETLGLVGESGSGKTTIGRILLRLVDPDRGTATFQGQDLFALRGAALREMRRHIQLVYQDPFSSVDPRFRARDIVAEPWVDHGLHDRAERRRRADALLERVGIDPALGDRRPASFSGGQLQRIGIARALALEPSLIVCDEPVSALDVSVQSQVLNLLLDLKAERGVSYLFIAHDLGVVRHVSDRIAVMYAGRIVESGGRDEVFDRPSHPYTQALLAATGADAAPAAPSPLAGPTSAAAEQGLRGALPSGCAFRLRCPRAGTRCADEVPALIERGQGHPVACHYPGPPDLPAGLDASSAARARIDGNDGHVGRQVDQGHQEPGDDGDAHDERGVQAAQAQQQVGPEPGHREGHLHDRHAREEAGDVEREDREER